MSERNYPYSFSELVRPVLIGVLGSALTNLISVDYIIPQKENWSQLESLMILGTVITPTLVGVGCSVVRSYRNSRD